MPSMFPPVLRGDDYSKDRRPAAETTSAQGELREPAVMKVAFYLLVGTSILMIVSGLVAATAGYTGDPNVEENFKEVVVRNQRFVGIFNMVLGLVVAALATQIRRGAKMSRRWLLGGIVLAVFFNMIAFMIKAGGFAFAIIPMLLAIGALLMYRPEANAYVHRSSEEEF